MSIGFSMRAARTSAGLTQRELADMMGVKHNTISDWENERTSPDTDQIVMLCNILRIDADKLLGVSVRPPHYTHAETPAIAAAYDKASDKDRLTVRTVLDVAEGKPLRIVAPRDVEIAAELVPELRHYEQPSAAGTGNYLDDDNYTMRRFVNTPQRANIAVSISGDSMEPKYSDGDIVFVETTSMLEDNEIGIFVVDGNSYIKLLRKNPLRLLSLNPERPNVDVDENTTFYVVGRVLGKAERV